MAKKRIYFVQTGCVINNEHFLPYAAGILAAYCFKNPKINSEYALADIIYKCDDFDSTVKAIINPSVFAFSNYMWNFKFNLKLAKRIKQLFPSCTIIFGGHQISNATEWLENHPFIDIAIRGEGEFILSEILLALCDNCNFSHIANIAYRNTDGIIENETKNICYDINELPSPYLTGIFDKILKNNSDKFAAVIETSRGCPYHCAYCDWGNYDIPMRHFNVERIKKEIDWLARNSVVFVVLADSNFGIIETDNEIINAFICAKKSYGYPKAVEIAFAKYSPDRVFSMNKKLYENNMSRGATLSLQTLCPAALKNIGRESMTKERFSKLIKLYAENNIPAYTELILGLPGETYESFCEGIEFLLDNGQHNSIHVFFCEILPNAIMSNEKYIEKHQIKLLKRDFILRNGIPSDGIDGDSQIVVATKTMNEDLFFKAIVYSFIIQVFHNFGLMRVPALYFHYEEHIKYYEFYNKLMDWLLKNDSSYTGEIFKRFLSKYKSCLMGKDTDTYKNLSFGTTQFNLPDGAFLELISSYDKFYNDMNRFLCSLSAPVHIKDELLCFQKLIIRNPQNSCGEACFSYNWVDFYINAVKNNNPLLKKEGIKLSVFTSTEYSDNVSFAEVVSIKGRRIGKSIILNDSMSFSFCSTDF